MSKSALGLHCAGARPRLSPRRRVAADYGPTTAEKLEGPQLPQLGWIPIPLPFHSPPLPVSYNCSTPVSPIPFHGPLFFPALRLNPVRRFGDAHILYRLPRTVSSEKKLQSVAKVRGEQVLFRSYLFYKTLSKNCT